MFGNGAASKVCLGRRDCEKTQTAEANIDVGEIYSMIRDSCCFGQCR